MASKEEKEDSKAAQLLNCSPCKRKNKNKEVVKYCVDCHDYYCEECVDVHNTFPALSGHKILEKSQFKSASEEDIPLVPTERCERHNFKVVDMYCKSHDRVGCYTCMAVEHRSCQDVLYVPEYVQDNTSVTRSDDVLKEMNVVVNKINQKLTVYKRESKRLLQRKVEEVERVKAFRIEINMRLDELEKMSIEEIEKQYTALIKKVDDDICALTTCLTDVTSSHDNIASTDGNTSQLFVSTKKGKLSAQRVKEQIKASVSEFSRRDLIFECNLKCRSLLEELTSLGEIIHKHAAYKVKDRQTFDIKHQSDRNDCNIHSICMLPDGTIVTADRNNEKLKRLDGSSYIINDIYDLRASPWQVCAVEEDEVAVSYGTRTIIQFINVEGKMKVSREIKPDHGCYGIACSNEILYVTDTNSAVFEYNMAGTKLRQFSSDQSGQSLFNNIYSLIVSSIDDEKIYVADYTHGLVVLNKDGKLIGKYKCPEMRGARDMCIMGDRSVLICSYSSNNIVQFTSDGEFVGEVLSIEDNNNICRAICFDSKLSRLIICRSNVNKIEVFEIV